MKNDTMSKTVAAARVLVDSIDHDQMIEIASKIAAGSATVDQAAENAKTARMIIENRRLADQVLEIMDIADEEMRAAEEANNFAGVDDYLARVPRHLADAAVIRLLVDAEERAPMRGGPGRIEVEVAGWPGRLMTMEETTAEARRNDVESRAEAIMSDCDGIEMIAIGIDEYGAKYDVSLTPEMLSVLLEAAARHAADPAGFWKGRAA